MLHLASGREIGGLLEHVSAHLGQYKRVVLSSPFIDEFGRRLIDRFYESTLTTKTRLDIVTTPRIAGACVLRWPAHYGFRVQACVGLHAKLYVAIGYRDADHVAIVTSANLTAAGLTENGECGLRVSGSTRALVSLIERLPARVGLHTHLATTRTSLR